MGILPIPYVNYENPSWLVSLAATKITGAFGAATFNGTATINKTGSNGLIVNNTLGNALAVFNASAASVTDNSYLTIQTAGADRWYIGQSVSSLTGNFEIYGTGFGGSMLTLNRTTGAMTANAATFNGNIVQDVGAGSNTIYQQGTASSNAAWITIGGGGSIARWSDGHTYINGVSSLTGTQIVLFSNNAVAIGTNTTPTTKFHVEGTSKFTDTATFNGSVSALALNADVGSNKPLKSYRDGSVAGFYTGASVSAETAWYMSSDVHYFTIGGSTRLDIGASDSRFTGSLTVTGLLNVGDYTVATLPSAAANAGYEANVTDSSVTTFGSTVAGSGSSRVKVYSNGTNWTVQAA